MTTAPRRWVWIAVVLAVTLLAGVAIGTLIGRGAGPGDRSVDAGFARDMSTHHAQAVSMAITTYGATTDPTVKQLALDIALTQQAQIGMMRTWLDGWGLSPTGTEPRMAWMADLDGHSHSAAVVDGLMPGMADPAEMDELRAASGDDLDVRFLQLMLRHHLGGIDMAEAAAEHAAEPAVRDLATSMATGQQYEVTVLEDQLTRYGAEPLPAR